MHAAAVPTEIQKGEEVGGKLPEAEESLCFGSRYIGGRNESGRFVQFAETLQRRIQRKNASEGSRKVVLVHFASLVSVIV